VSTFPTPWSIVASVAFDEDQVRVEHFPSAIEAGSAESDTAGTDGGGGTRCASNSI
jgi:hypothetical protein